MRELNFFVALAILIAPLASEAAPSAKKEKAKVSVSKKVSTKKTTKLKRAVADDSGLKVMPLDPYYPTEQLQNYQVEDSNGILNPHHRDQLFQSAGLGDSVKGWDHFEKDMLYMRVKNENINEVVSRYPLIPSEKIIRLKGMMAK